MSLINHINTALAPLPVYWYRLSLSEATNLSQFALVQEVGVTEMGTKDSLIYNGRLTVSIYKKDGEAVTVEQYISALKPNPLFVPSDCFIYEVQDVRRTSIQLGSVLFVETRIGIKFAKTI